MIKKYDDRIKKATENHLNGADWRLLKAQIQAESAFDPNARSPAGAMGLAQFMPKTWAEVARELKFEKNTSPYDESPSIIAAAYYMQKLYNGWIVPRPYADQYCLAMASYNAGFGNILKAQKKAGGAADYHTIISHLHLVTGDKNSKETIRYVEKILKTFTEYVAKGH